MSVARKSIVAVSVSLQAVIATRRLALEGAPSIPLPKEVSVPADMAAAGDCLVKMAAEEGRGVFAWERSGTLLTLGHQPLPGCSAGSPEGVQHSTQS